jgi:carboxylesterase type B
VAVFIHGGMMILGASSDAPYDATLLASEGVVLVAINYRLNTFGFSTFDETTRNNGMRDQRRALEWVSANIHLFGGDSEQISVFGESAGATSTAIQALYELNHPQEKQIIKRIITESNPLGITLGTPETKAALWKNFEISTKPTIGFGAGGPAQCFKEENHCKKGVIYGHKCNDVDHFFCMRQNLDNLEKRNERITLTANSMTMHGAIKGTILRDLYGFGATMDGVFITAEPQADIVNLLIPSIQGTNLNEGGYFIDMVEAVTDAFGQGTVFGVMYGLNKGVGNYYEDIPDLTPARHVAMSMTDYLFACPQALNMGKPANKAFHYQIRSADLCSCPAKGLGDCESASKECISIACHANEVPLVFGTWGVDGMCCSADNVAKYSEYSEYMRKTWTDFFKGINPVDAVTGTGVWTFGLDKDANFVVGSNAYEMEASRLEGKPDVCDFFRDNIGWPVGSA